MCPLCLNAAVLYAAGASSAAGITALVVKPRRNRAARPAAAERNAAAPAGQTNRQRVGR